VTEQQRGSHGAAERGEIRYNVVDRSDKPLLQDVGDSNEETACEGDGQENTHHGRSLADAMTADRYSPRHPRSGQSELVSPRAIRATVPSMRPRVQRR
jgi:hypothetical protein